MDTSQPPLDLILQNLERSYWQDGPLLRREVLLVAGVVRAWGGRTEPHPLLFRGFGLPRVPLPSLLSLLLTAWTAVGVVPVFAHPNAGRQMQALPGLRWNRDGPISRQAADAVGPLPPPPPAS